RQSEREQCCKSEQEQGLDHVSCQPQDEQCDSRPGENGQWEAHASHPFGDHRHGVNLAASARTSVCRHTHTPLLWTMLSIKLSLLNNTLKKHKTERQGVFHRRASLRNCRENE